MRILCYGDSNTYGYDPRSFTGDRYASEHRWTDLSFPGHTVLNAGENGRSVPFRPHEFALVHSLTERYAPIDRMIVMLGTNDLLQGRTPEETCARMEMFLSQLPGIPLFLLAPPPMQRGVWVEDDSLVAASLRLAQLYRMLADRLTIPFADAGAWQLEITFDGVHLSEAGHKTLAAGLAAALKQKEIL